MFFFRQVLLFEFCYTCFQLSITHQLLNCTNYSENSFPLLNLTPKFALTFWHSASFDRAMKLTLCLSILFLLESHDCKHREMKSVAFSFVTDPKFMNLTIDTANETHLGAIKWRAMEKLLTLSVSSPKWLCEAVPSFVTSKF